MSGIQRWWIWNVRIEDIGWTHVAYDGNRGGLKSTSVKLEFSHRFHETDLVMRAANDWCSNDLEKAPG